MSAAMTQSEIISFGFDFQLGYGKIVDILIQNGADVNAGNPSTEKTPLHFAAASGKLKFLSLKWHLN